ncbi:hypothetical protein NU10_03335 [Flavobacterium dauae]|uniref:hypothetical protein n=1 Tax=Flavobacterium dauae TaxID=1563479 RepID=UPI00101B3F37|nr:hypothetical protein [Flavobacterium dauae]WLD24445.1 hypothetical protein NU10_03335 [Flavobacterium dauae]
MKKILLTVFLAASTVFISCKDDDNVTETTKLPKSITSTYNRIDFTYNAARQLVKITDKDSETDYSETIFTYDTSGRPVKFVMLYNEDGAIETYSYTISYPLENQAKIVSEDNETTIVKFDAKGQVTSFNNLSETINYTYDNRGNVVKIIDEDSTVTASYNNNKGILSGVSSAKWVLLLTDFDLFYFGTNNPVSVSSVSENNGNTYTSSEAYTYPAEHIIDGYPTRMSVNYTENGSTENEVYTITY